MPRATPGIPCFFMPALILASSSSKSEPAAETLPSPEAAGEEVSAPAGAGKPTSDVAVAAATVPVAVLRNSLRVSRLGCCWDIRCLPSFGRVSGAAHKPSWSLPLFTLPREVAHPPKGLDFVRFTAYLGRGAIRIG